LEEPTDSDVTPGGTILFTCIAKVNEEIVTEVTWTKDQHPLNQSRRIQILVGGTLMISNAQAGDVGVYQCSANLPNGSLKFFVGEPNQTLFTSKPNKNVFVFLIQ
jgi:hypothetical protein